MKRLENIASGNPINAAYDREQAGLYRLADSALYLKRIGRRTTVLNLLIRIIRNALRRLEAFLELLEIVSIENECGKSSRHF